LFNCIIFRDFGNVNENYSGKISPLKRQLHGLTQAKRGGLLYQDSASFFKLVIP
jgi:hypothetical protein